MQNAKIENSSVVRFGENGYVKNENDNMKTNFRLRTVFHKF